LERQQTLLDDDMRVPIILVTGRGDDLARVTARRAGAAGSIHKPFDDQSLVDTVCYQ